MKRNCGVACDVGTHVSCPGYVSTQQAHGMTVNQGGTADKRLFVLDRQYSVGGVFVYPRGGLQHEAVYQTMAALNPSLPSHFQQQSDFRRNIL